MRAKLIGAVAVMAAAGALCAQAAPLRVKAIRVWSPGSVTRIAIEVSGDFEHHAQTLHNPPRVFFDIFRASPWIDGKRAYSARPQDKLVSRVRVAETLPGVTRVVLDLSRPAEYTVSKMANPDRLVVELRPAPPAEAGAAESAPAAPDAALPAPPPQAGARTVPETAAPAPVAVGPAAAAKPSATAAPPLLSKPAAPAPAPEPPAAPAARTTEGKNSLIRALGLKIQRIVIDPGHGGHDQGTVGRRGLVEKDLVLDIAKRLGALVEQQIGCEVVYTRTDDIFIPLEARTELANGKKADLFISLHANSSRYPRIAGVETFYLNFTTDRDAMDVAARENASSNKNVSELQDVLQRIARQEKIDESKELAKFVQSTMHGFSARYVPGVKNRGVKKAPFLVLVGAQMPSVLVEIGFLSNSREETLLRRPDHRQKVADALLQGISRYMKSLSHFQVAQANDE